MYRYNVAKASLVLLLMMFFSKITGFVREMVFAYYYGTTLFSDHYVVATTICTSLFSGLIYAIGTAYIPLATQEYSKGKGIDLLTSQLLNFVTILSLAISILCSFAAFPISKIFASGFEKDSIEQIANMVRIILPFCALNACATLLSSYLQVKQTFWVVGGVTVLTNLVIMASFFFSKQNIVFLCIGYILSMLASALMCLGVAIKHRYHYSFSVDINNPQLKYVLWIALPIFISGSAFQLNTLIDRTFASTLGEGIISAMQYANKLNVLFSSTVVTALATALLPALANAAMQDDNYQSIKNQSAKMISIILFLSIFITTTLLAFSKELVEVTFMRGAFNLQSAIMTSGILKIYSLSIFALGINEILMREFYALKDTKTPVVMTCISFGFNIILNILLIKPLGYYGLAIATSGSSVLLCLMLFVSLRKKIGDLGLVQIAKNTRLLLIGAGISFLLMFGCKSLLPISGAIGKLGGIALSVFVGGVGYLICCHALKVPETVVIQDFIVRFRRGEK